MKSALHRFNWQYRIIRDENGAELGHGIPNDQDKRKPRAQQSATGKWLVRHEGRNRKRRRELARQYKVTGGILATNRPVKKEGKIYVAI